MILQPKSATSLPLDLAGIPATGDYTYEVETDAAADRSAAAMVTAVARNYEEEEETLYIDCDDEELDRAAIKGGVKGAYAASPTLAAKLEGLAFITRGPEYDPARTPTPPAWVTQSATFERKAPLNLVVKGVAKPRAKGHWICVAGTLGSYK